MKSACFHGAFVRRERFWTAVLVAMLALGATVIGPGQPLTGLACISAAWVCVGIGVARARRAKRCSPPPLATASWAQWPEASSQARPGPFLLGLWPGTQTRLYLGEEQLSGHVLVVGPSRSGKTAGVIAPNVLLRDPKKESLVVLDVKSGPRSLWNVTAGRYGPRARLFCPFFEESVGYNPLEDVESVGAAQRKAALLIRNTTPRDLSGDAHVYAAAAEDLATLLFLHVQQERAGGGHTVGAVYRLLLRGPAAVRDALRTSRVDEVRERQGMFASRERRVQEAAVTGLLERLSPWADPLVEEATRRHWDVRLLGQEPSALYILLPEADARRLQPLVAWLVADILDGLVEMADRRGRICPVRLFLDEFRQFGYLAGLADRLPTLRERSISVVLGVQVMTQIAELYGEWETRSLVGNTETKVIFRAGDLETAQLVSRWLGHTVVPAVSVTVRGTRERAATIHPVVRPLLAPEDVRRIPEGALIALSGSLPPLALRQARYFATPGFALVPPPFPLRRRATPALSVGRPQEGDVDRRRTPPPPLESV
jgi:type IV secretion system protein VirD4